MTKWHLIIAVVFIAVVIGAFFLGQSRTSSADEEAAPNAAAQALANAPRKFVAGHRMVCGSDVNFPDCKIPYGKFQALLSGEDKYPMVDCDDGVVPGIKNAKPQPETADLCGKCWCQKTAPAAN